MFSNTQSFLPVILVFLWIKTYLCIGITITHNIRPTLVVCKCIFQKFVPKFLWLNFFHLCISLTKNWNNNYIIHKEQCLRSYCNWKQIYWLLLKQNASKYQLLLQCMIMSMILFIRSIQYFIKLNCLCEFSKFNILTPNIGL